MTKSTERYNRQREAGKRTSIPTSFSQARERKLRKVRPAERADRLTYSTGFVGSFSVDSDGLNGGVVLALLQSYL